MTKSKHHAQKPRNRSRELTQARLKEFLHYDPDTGLFTWIAKSSPYSFVKFGYVAGSLHKRTGHWNIKIDKKTYQASRLAWLYVYGLFPKGEINHIDGDNKNNSLSNLKERITIDKTREITQSYLKEILNYDPETGLFTWKVEKDRNISGADIAGYLDKSDGYFRIRIGKRHYKAHRLAWLYIHGRWPSEQIDHINRNRSDNRLCNLRECTHAQNQQNRSSVKKSSSKYLGVSWDNLRSKWRAQIQINGKNKNLGAFDTEAEANEAYLAAKAELHKFQPIPRKSKKNLAVRLGEQS